MGLRCGRSGLQTGGRQGPGCDGFGSGPGSGRREHIRRGREDSLRGNALSPRYRSQGFQAVGLRCGRSGLQTGGRQGPGCDGFGSGPGSGGREHIRRGREDSLRGNALSPRYRSQGFQAVGLRCGRSGLQTAGGRVLGVTASGPDLSSSRREHIRRGREDSLRGNALSPRYRSQGFQAVGLRCGRSGLRTGGRQGPGCDRFGSGPGSGGREHMRRGREDSLRGNALSPRYRSQGLQAVGVKGSLRIANWRAAGS